MKKLKVKNIIILQNLLREFEEKSLKVVNGNKTVKIVYGL